MIQYGPFSDFSDFTRETLLGVLYDFLLSRMAFIHRLLRYIFLQWLQRHKILLVAGILKEIG